MMTIMIYQSIIFSSTAEMGFYTFELHKSIRKVVHLLRNILFTQFVWA